MLLAVTAMATTALVVSSSPADAAFDGTKLPGSNFEIDDDANLVLDDPSPSTDWLNDAGTAMRSGVIVKPDEPSGSADDSFGNGTKEDTAVPSVVDGSIPPNKSDLKHFGVLKDQSASGSFLYLFWTRVQDPSGTTNMDFEFNQSSTLSSNGVTSVRTEGDLLIQYDLSNGGTNATLSKRIWSGTAWGAAQSLTGAQAIGSINSNGIAAGNAGGLGSLSARTFGEAAIDLAAIFPSGQCTNFGYAYLKSRSSDAFNSAVKDFIAPVPVNLTNCGSIPIHKQDDNGTALAGATFTLYTNVAPLAAPRGAGDTATSLSCTTDASGDCTISNVPFGDYWIVETVTPANHDTAADVAITVALSGNTPSGTITVTDPRQRGSIIVRKNDPSGNRLAGAAFAVSGNGLSSTAMVEYATGLFCLDDLLYGQYTITETTVPAGYTGAAPTSFTVSTKSTCAGRLGNPVNTNVTADVVVTNSPTPGTINVLKTDDLANPLAGAGFTLFKDIGVVGTYQPLTDTQVQAGPITTTAAGTASFTNVPLGDYCVVETTTPAGYDTAAAQCVTVGLGQDPNTGVTINLTFVDPRQIGSIIVRKNDQSGAFLAGAGFTVSKSGFTSTAMTQVATGLFCLDGLPYGTYTVSETTTPAGYTTAANQSFTVGTRTTCAGRLGSPPNTGVTPDLTFVNNPTPGQINVLKKDDANNALQGASFTLFVDVGTVGTYEPGTDSDVQAGPLSTNASGQLSFTSVPLGNYCVVETGTPTGYDTAAAQCVTIALGSAANTGQTLNLTFVDPRQHKVIVFVCHEGTNTLDASSVTIDGSTTKTSASSVPAALSGVTEQQLCGISSGASFGNLSGHSTRDLDVVID